MFAVSVVCFPVVAVTVCDFVLVCNCGFVYCTVAGVVVAAADLRA